MVGGRGRVEHSPVRRSSRNSVGGRNFTADSGQSTSTGGVTSSPFRRSRRFSRQSDAGAANNESSVMSATFESTRAHGRESFGRLVGKHGFKVRDTAATAAGPESGGEIFDDTLCSSSSIPMSQSQHKRVLTKFSEKIPAAMLANQSQDSLEDSMMEALTLEQNRAIMKKHAVLIPAELIGNNDSLIEENLPTRAGMKQAFAKFGKKFTEAELRAIEEAQHEEEEVSAEEEEEVNEEEEEVIAEKPPAPVVSTSSRLSTHSEQQTNANKNDNELAEFAKPSQGPPQRGAKPATRRRLSMNSVDTQVLNEKSFINSTPVKNAPRKTFGIGLDRLTPIPPSTAARTAKHRPSLAGSAVAPLNRTSRRDSLLGDIVPVDDTPRAHTSKSRKHDTSARLMKSQSTSATKVCSQATETSESTEFTGTKETPRPWRKGTRTLHPEPDNVEMYDEEDDAVPVATPVGAVSQTNMKLRSSPRKSVPAQQPSPRKSQDIRSRAVIGDEEESEVEEEGLAPVVGNRQSSSRVMTRHSRKLSNSEEEIGPGLDKSSTSKVGPSVIAAVKRTSRRGSGYIPPVDISAMPPHVHTSVSRTRQSQSTSRAKDSSQPKDSETSDVVVSRKTNMNLRSSPRKSVLAQQPSRLKTQEIRSRAVVGDEEESEVEAEILAPVVGKRQSSRAITRYSRKLSDAEEEEIVIDLYADLDSNIGQAPESPIIQAKGTPRKTLGRPKSISRRSQSHVAVQEAIDSDLSDLENPEEDEHFTHDVMNENHEQHTFDQKKETRKISSQSVAGMDKSSTSKVGPNTSHTSHSVTRRDETRKSQSTTGAKASIQSNDSETSDSDDAVPVLPVVSKTNMNLRASPRKSVPAVKQPSLRKSQRLRAEIGDEDNEEESESEVDEILAASPPRVTKSSRISKSVTPSKEKTDEQNKTKTIQTSSSRNEPTKRTNPPKTQEIRSRAVIGDDEESDSALEEEAAPRVTKSSSRMSTQNLSKKKGEVENQTKIRQTTSSSRNETETGKSIPQTAVRSNRPSVAGSSARLNILTDPFDKYELNAAEKISLGTKKKSRTQILRSRSTANAPHSDSSSEAEDVSSFIVPRKKKAGKVSSMTASEVYAGVLSQASKTSITLGGGSQSSSQQLQSQQRGASQSANQSNRGAIGEVSQAEMSSRQQNLQKSMVKVLALNRKQSSGRSVGETLGNIVEDESSFLEIDLSHALPALAANTEPLNAKQPNLEPESENVMDVEQPMDTNDQAVDDAVVEDEQEQRNSDSELSEFAEEEVVVNKPIAQEKRMSISKLSHNHKRVSSKKPEKSGTSVLSGFGEDVDDSDSEPEVIRRMSMSRKESRKKTKHAAAVKVIPRRSLGRPSRPSKSNTSRRSHVVVEEVIGSDLSDLENQEDHDEEQVQDEQHTQVADINQELHTSAVGQNTETGQMQAQTSRQSQSVLDKNDTSKARPSIAMAAGGSTQHLNTPLNRIHQKSAQQSFDALRTSMAEEIEPEAGTSAVAGPSRRIAHPGAVAAPKKALQKRLKPEVEEADWNETRESALVAAKQRKKKKAADLRSNANMILKEKIAGFYMAMGEELSKTELNRVHAVANTMIEKFLDKLCSTTSNPNGMFSYKELEEALKAQGWISGKKNTLALEFATAFTPEKLHKMMGFLIPNPGEEDTNFDHIYD